MSAVGQHEECVLSIRNVDSTSSGEHKVSAACDATNFSALCHLP